jgi:predicted Zn-ribbon and HTH transcriptional regulator
MKATCQSCGWSQVVPQQGDVIFTPKTCERCESEKLTFEKAGVLDRLNLMFTRKIALQR